MRVLLSLAFLLSSAALEACSPALSTPHPPVILRLGGSDSMQSLAHDLADAYRQTHPYATIEIHGGNSSSGLAELARGSLDIAMVSSSPPADELRRPPARAVEIARDGIAVIVNPSNPVTNLTRDQLAKVFSGALLNWDDLSGQEVRSGNDLIQVVSREDGSGTRRVFEQTIMTGRRVTLTSLIEPSSLQVLKFVESNPGAVGYAAANLWRGNSKARALSIDNVVPSIQSIHTSAYPLMQTYYFVLLINSGPEVADFVDFVLSPLARGLISARMAPPR
jgi:phosphate transport system substrate-binding protein